MNCFVFRNLRDEECRATTKIVAKNLDNHIATKEHVRNGSRICSNNISGTWSISCALKHSDYNRIAVINVAHVGKLPEDCTCRNDWLGDKGEDKRPVNQGNASQELVWKDSIPEISVCILIDDKDISEMHSGYCDIDKIRFADAIQDIYDNPYYSDYIAKFQDIIHNYQIGSSANANIHIFSREEISSILKEYNSGMSHISSIIDKATAYYLSHGNIEKARGVVISGFKMMVKLKTITQEYLQCSDSILNMYPIPTVEHSKYRCTEPEKAQEQWSKIFEPEKWLTPTDKFNLASVRYDASSIEFMDNPCSLVQIEAVQQQPELIKFIQMPCE